MTLEGKTVVVLGASAEGGSGWATAELAHARGANVVVGARRFDGVQKLADKINGLAVKCDAGIESNVAAMADAAMEKYGSVDVAILSAGVPIVGKIDELDDESWSSAMQNNFYSSVYFVRQMAKRMKSGDAITLVTSLSVSRPVPGYAGYACAKGAAEILVKYAALEYADRNIRINAVSGGLIESPMSAAIRAVPEAWNVFLKEVPLGRAVQPKEIGAACLWLASPEAAVTGVVLDVDNGNHLLRSPQPNEMVTGIYEQGAKSAGY